ncbi:hypothetical protein F5Y04DRAFT_242842 [Hypomontagnella monticulosa]|nr:hypothetical protein F5Y04DRAFT_242842 [Hypomontagnella monticulosa]
MAPKTQKGSQNAGPAVIDALKPFAKVKETEMSTLAEEYKSMGGVMGKIANYGNAMMEKTDPSGRPTELVGGWFHTNLAKAIHHGQTELVEFEKGVASLDDVSGLPYPYKSLGLDQLGHPFGDVPQLCNRYRSKIAKWKESLEQWDATQKRWAEEASALASSPGAASQGSSNMQMATTPVAGEKSTTSSQIGATPTHFDQTTGQNDGNPTDAGGKGKGKEPAYRGGRGNRGGRNQGGGGRGANKNTGTGAGSGSGTGSGAGAPGAPGAPGGSGGDGGGRGNRGNRGDRGNRGGRGGGKNPNAPKKPPQKRKAGDDDDDEAGPSQPPQKKKKPSPSASPASLPATPSRSLMPLFEPGSTPINPIMVRSSPSSDNSSRNTSSYATPPAPRPRAVPKAPAEEASPEDDDGDLTMKDDGGDHDGGDDDPSDDNGGNNDGDGDDSDDEEDAPFHPPGMRRPGERGLGDYREYRVVRVGEGFARVFPERRSFNEEEARKNLVFDEDNNKKKPKDPKNPKKPVKKDPKTKKDPPKKNPPKKK